jgi:hypothetical protein
MATFCQQKKHQKTSDNFYCQHCDFSCCKKGDFNRHLKTKKHLATNLHQITSNYIAASYVCECGKNYKDRTGLWKHKKMCELEQHNIFSNCNPISESEMSKMTTLFMESVKQNQELLLQNQDFQKKMFDLMKESGGVINSHNTITTNNTKFNLNFFLNETCKDAMNLSEFVDSLKITITDLENVGKLGYTEGISRIFTKGLKELELHKRPIHCSDLKRETVYVKNDNKWEKEGDQLRKAIKQITNKNIKLIPKWKEENPGHQQYHNNKNDEYLKIMYESMGPTNEMEEEKSFSKIITNLAKETVIMK